MTNSKGAENNRPLDVEELTLEQDEKVVGGVQSRCNFNTSNVNTSNFNASNFNTSKFNDSKFNDSKFNASNIVP